MSFFKKIFSKEKKETLDKGLEKSKESFFGKLTKAVAGKSKVDDDVLDNLEEILVASDVGVDTTLKIINRIEARVAKDKYVGTDELNSILREEIAGLLSETNKGNETEFTIPEIPADKNGKISKIRSLYFRRSNYGSF
jgi:fused signal recognition particle receptor